MKVHIISFDKERQRDLFFSATLGRYSYYEEAGTVFDSEEDAKLYARYSEMGEIKTRPVHNGRSEP